MGVKEKIHQLIDTCSDDAVLNSALEMLEQNKASADWWDELNEEQKKKTLASLEQGVNGQTITHEMLRSKIWAKFTL
jgi:hypothetical protein